MMSDTLRKSLKFLTEHALRVSALVMASVWRGREYPQVLRALRQAPAARRRMVVLGVLGTLFALAVLAASFGPIGLGAYFLAIVFLVR